MSFLPLQNTTANTGLLAQLASQNMQTQPTWQQRLGLQTPTGNVFDSPMMRMGMGLLSGNTGRSKGEAFANSMGGGLRGLLDAQRARELASVQQMRQMQMQNVSQGMQAQKAKQERLAQQRAAMGVTAQRPQRARKREGHAWPIAYPRSM